MKKVPAAKHDRFVEVPPNAARTLGALREMGYDSFASVMDLVDNSIDAQATEINVTVREVGKSIIIDIVDNGVGMDEKTLAEALRLGSDTDHEAGKHLGKFGMGLVTASLSLARNIWVLTRREGKPAYEATFDMNDIERENRFIITLRDASGKTAIDNLDQDHGTMVRLSNIDRINDRNVARFAGNLRERLGRVYRHYLDKGLKIAVNKRNVVKYDPLMLDHPATEVVLDTTFDLGDGTTAKLVAVELPELGMAGDQEAGIFPDNSGFYVVRNNREIIAGETFGFYKKHHSYSHFRAELSYTGNSTVFHEDIKKASIHPDDRLLEKLRRLTEKLITASGRRGKDRADDQPIRITHQVTESVINTYLAKEAGASELVQRLQEEAPKKRGRPTKDEQAEREERERREREQLAKVPKVQFTEVEGSDTARFFSWEAAKNGSLTITYNSRHPFVRLVAAAKQRQASSILDMLAFSLAKAEQDVPEGKKLVNKACDYLKVLSLPGGADGKA